MATDCIPQITFNFDKSVVARFDAEHTSSDGGAVLLKAIDRRLGVTDTVARCMRDRRQPGKVQHFPVILFGSAYWGGLIEWVRTTVLPEGKVAIADLDLRVLCDSPIEVRDMIVRSIDEQRWRSEVTELDFA